MKYYVVICKVAKLSFVISMIDFAKLSDNIVFENPFFFEKSPFEFVNLQKDFIQN